MVLGGKMPHFDFPPRGHGWIAVASTQQKEMTYFGAHGTVTRVDAVAKKVHLKDGEFRRLPRTESCSQPKIQAPWSSMGLLSTHAPTRNVV